MLDRFFHAWENRLASVTKDRVVRPFEWGVEWLSPNGRNEHSPGVQVERWVDEVMRDTQAFFTPPPTGDFHFERASKDAQRTGEAGTLRFPSAFTSPHQENNTVTARWFPSRSARSAAISEGRRAGPFGPAGAVSGPGRAVVVLSQWNADAGGHIGLSRILARFGVSALRMSLPYHDARMPPELTRADYIVSSNIARTVQVCRQAVLDARRSIDWLASQGFERIGILGTSLGSCLAMLASAHEPRIRAQALNHVSPYFADVVWRGLSTRHVRDGLEGHVDLDRLRTLWRPISPFSYLEGVRHAQTLLVYARYDLTFPVDLSRLLVDEFRRRELPHQVVTLPCGHYSSGAAPFKYVDGYVLTRFLRRNL